MVAAGIPIYLAFRGGGYDIVARQEAGLVLWWVVALGFAFGFLPRGRPERRAFLPLVALACLVVWTALSLAWTQSDELTFTELARVLDYAGLVVLAWSALSGSTWKAAAAGISVAALAVPAISLASRLDPAAFPQSEVARIFGGDRLSYPLDYWNGVAAWAAMGSALGLAWSAHVRRPGPRALSLAAVVVAAVAIYLTYSRTGVIGYGLAVLTVLVLGRNRWTTAVHAVGATAAAGAVIGVIQTQGTIAHGTSGAGGGVVALAVLVAAGACAALAVATRRWGLDQLETTARVGRLALVATLVLGLGAAAVVGPRLASRASDQFRTTGYPTASSDPAARLVSLQGSRYQVWSSAWRAFESDPLEGIGPGTFEFWWVRDVPNGEPLRDAHSLFLQTLAELGIPGFLFLVVFLAGMWGAAIAVRRRFTATGEIGAIAGLMAAFIVFVVAAGVDWMWELSAVPVLGIGAIAIAGSAGFRSRPRRRRLTAARIAIVVLAVVAGAVQVPGLVSTVRTRDSAKALAVGFRGQALTLAESAVDAEPWAASPYAQRALVELSQGRPLAARRDARRAIAREPNNWHHRLLLFRTEVAAGDKTAAMHALDGVERLDPGAARQVAKLRRAVREATPTGAKG